MALILVRHPPPSAHDAGRCYGRLNIAAPPLPATAARALVTASGRIARVVASPSGRCRLPALALARRLRVPLRLDPGWRELDFGSWEGRPWDAVPRPGLDAWAADLMHARPHGGESVAMLRARVRRALARLPRCGTTLVVTHAGPIRAAVAITRPDPAAWSRAVPFLTPIRLPR